MVLNKRERATKQDLEEQGYETIHQGIQDFTAVKGRCPHHEFCPYIHFVETKSETDKLSLDQRRARSILKKHGFKVTVERRTENGEIYHASPTTSAPEQNTPDHSIRPVQNRTIPVTPFQPTLVQPKPALPPSRTTYPLPANLAQPLPRQTNQAQTTPRQFNPNVEEVK